MARERSGRRAEAGRGAIPTRPAARSLPGSAPGSNPLETGRFEQQLAVRGQHEIDEVLGRSLVVARVEDGDRVVGDHVLIIWNRHSVDLAARDDIADVNDPRICFAERDLAQDAGYLLLEAGRLDGDSGCFQRLSHVLARRDGRVRQHDNQSRSCQVGQGVYAFWIALGDGDLEAVVSEYVGRTRDQTTGVHLCHVSYVGRGEN